MNVLPPPPIVEKGLSKKKTFVIGFLIILAIAALALFFLGQSGNESSSRSAVVLASYDDGVVDYIQIGSSDSVETIVDEAGKTQLEEMVQIQILSEGVFSARSYVSLSDGDVAFSYRNKEKEGLKILDITSGSSIDLIEPDYFSLSSYYSSTYSKFFVTVSEDDRTRCLSVDLKGNQVQLGRGYCKLLTNDLVLVVDEDDDSDRVMILTFDSEGAEVGEVEVELSGMSTTPSGDLLFGFSENADGASLFTVLNSDGTNIWQASPDFLETIVIDVLNNGLVVAVDEGEEIEILRLITAASETGDVRILAEAEKISTFSSPNGNAIFVSAVSQDSEFDSWEMFTITSEANPESQEFYSGELTSMYFVPDSETILGWNSSNSELLIGTANTGLTDLADFEASISQIFVMQNQVYVLSDGELWVVNEVDLDVDKIAEDIASVTEVSRGESNAFVYMDTNDNYRLARIIDGSLIEIDEDDLILGLHESGSSKLYYSTAESDSSNIELYSVDLVNDAGEQRAKVGKRIANDTVIISESSTWEDFFLGAYEGKEAVANIDSRRRACKDENLQILESGASTTFQVLPPEGAYFCISVSERDLETISYFEIEVSSDIDLEMEVFQENEVLYAEDDERNSSGGRVSYNPSIFNMELEAGTYRVHIFPEEPRPNLGSPSTVTFQGSTDYVERETSTTSPTDTSTSGCDVTVDSFETQYFDINYDSKQICFIQDPDDPQEIVITNLGAYDGGYLDVTLTCDTFSDTVYTDYENIFYSIDAGKGVERCEIRETFSGDGSYGQVSVSMSMGYVDY
jgi:hypothetical protein